MADIGIVSYGAYIPRYRIATKEIARVWGADGEAMSRGLNLNMKSVPGPDEDVITISVEATRAMLAKMAPSKFNPERIGAVYVGSESHPYAVKPTATFVAEEAGCTPHMTAADMEFACKAGTAAMQCCLGLVGSGIIDTGLAVGVDTSQGAPGDALEYSASAGGAAFLFGSANIIAKVNGTYSRTTETPDFWRREGAVYPTHAGRFTGEPAYFGHVVPTGKMLMQVMGTKPSDYAHLVLHQPNGKFPLTAGKELGFSKEQMAVGLLTPEIGNTYSGSSPLGLCAVLDIAKPGDRILVVSYGSGSGSDGFDITVLPSIDDPALFDRKGSRSVRTMVETREMIDYATYARFRGKIRMSGVGQ